MLVQHNFWDITNTDTVLKNPSHRRVVFRDSLGQVIRIEKFTYSFAERGLILTEITEAFYTGGIMDTVFVFKLNNGAMSLHQKMYDLEFERYDPLKY